MSKLRDMLLSNVEELELELDTAFEEGETSEHVTLEELFGLNGETVDGFGNVTIEDVAAHYKQALEFYLSNKPTVEKIVGQFIELPASSLESYPRTATGRAVDTKGVGSGVGYNSVGFAPSSDATGFAGSEFENDFGMSDEDYFEDDFGEYTETGPSPEDSLEDDVIYAVIF